MTSRLRILLTNDDGAATPSSGNSPFIYPFALALQQHLNADVRVVVPASQQSWKGKAYMIADKIKGTYFYPAVGEGEDGTRGERRELPKREEERKEGEMEWVLLDGTPCTSRRAPYYSTMPTHASTKQLLAPISDFTTFSLLILSISSFLGALPFPSCLATLPLISSTLCSPNFGRNTSTAFALSSGTLGAALAASLSGLKSIAVSYGLMAGYKNPTPTEFVMAANEATCKIVKKLYEEGWKEGGEKVDVYSINVPVRLPFPLSPDLHGSGGNSPHSETAPPRNRLFPLRPMDNNGQNGLRFLVQAPFCHRRRRLHRFWRA
jgi:tubulin--tyrosine ligase